MEPKAGETSASYIDSSERNETTPLQGVHHEQKGLRVIISCLSILTVLVSVALGAQIYYGDNEPEHHGSIVTDSNDCSSIGIDILRKGGNAVDAAVASTICLGVVLPHLTGIGGGGFLLIYDQRAGKPIDCIDFRSSKSSHPVIGVPGFLSGLSKGISLYGRMSWNEILKPSISLARKGFRISESLTESSSLLTPNSEDNLNLKNWIQSLKAGSMMTFDDLADSLEKAATYGSDAFYDGILAKSLSGYILSQDVKDYEPGLQSCLNWNYLGFNFHSPGSGSGGPVLRDLLMHLNYSEPFHSVLYSAMIGLQGFEDLGKLFHSGVHVAAVDDDDLYVSIVSGLGQVLGSQKLMPGGYILNNALEMGRVGSDKKIQSLAVPLVFVENDKICGSRYILGGSDARDVIQLLAYILLLKEDLQSSVEAPRARLSSIISIEGTHAPSFTASELDLLKSLGFAINVATPPYPSLNAIYKVADDLFSYADSRGQGGSIII